jgi:deoxyribonuclease V
VAPGRGEGAVDPVAVSTVRARVTPDHPVGFALPGAASTVRSHKPYDHRGRPGATSAIHHVRATLHGWVAFQLAGVRSQDGIVSGAAGWPTSVTDLIAAQRAVADVVPPPWPAPGSMVVAGCFVCFARGQLGRGAEGDPAWAAAAAYRRGKPVGRSSIVGTAGAPYLPGLLALRSGALLDTAVRSLPLRPDVLLVDATGSDHPRRAGLARQLGATLDLPTIGVTHRPLLADGDWPSDERGAVSPLTLDGVLVGFWLRTRSGRRPLAVHAGWRTDPRTAVQVVLAVTRKRTPAPLREARRLARTARADDDRADS